jgi:hypothetical protein
VAVAAAAEPPRPPGRWQGNAAKTAARDTRYAGRTEYRDRFLQLARYAPADVADDRKKQEHFMEGEVIAFLFFLVGPCKHHVSQCYNRARYVSSETSVQLLRGEAIVKAVVHIIICYVGDGGLGIKESLYVRSQGFTSLLFAQS